MAMDSIGGLLRSSFLVVLLAAVGCGSSSKSRATRDGGPGDGGLDTASGDVWPGDANVSGPLDNAQDSGASDGPLSSADLRDAPSPPSDAGAGSTEAGPSADGADPGVDAEVLVPDASVIEGGFPDGGEAKVCGMPEFKLDRSSVDVLIVLDISGSLERTVATGGTRWSNEYPAVLEVVQATQADLDWGLKMFPDKDGTTCLVRPGVDVPVAPMNYDAIYQAIGPLKSMVKPPGNGTPTGDAIIEAVKYLKSLNSTKPQYMVLATDGEPNCSVGGATSHDNAQDVAAVRDAASQGIATFVIAVNDELKSNKVLNDMAVAGGRARLVNPLVEPVFYVSEDRAGLVKAMNEIAGKLASCVFALASPPPSPSDVAADIVKRTDGTKERAPRDTSHVDGWDYTSSEHLAIEFFGSWCEKVQNVGNTVKFIFGCPGVVIP